MQTPVLTLKPCFRVTLMTRFSSSLGLLRRLSTLLRVKLRE